MVTQAFRPSARCVSVARSCCSSPAGRKAGACAIAAGEQARIDLLTPVPITARMSTAALRPAGGWYGPLASYAQRCFFCSHPQPSRPSERPVDSAAGHGNAGDVAADMPFEGGLPGNEAESEPVIDHGEPAAG